MEKVETEILLCKHCGKEKSSLVPPTMFKWTYQSWSGFAESPYIKCKICNVNHEGEENRGEQVWLGLEENKWDIYEKELSIAEKSAVKWWNKKHGLSNDKPT